MPDGRKKGCLARSKGAGMLPCVQTILTITKEFYGDGDTSGSGWLRCSDVTDCGKSRGIFTAVGTAVLIPERGTSGGPKERGRCFRGLGRRRHLRR